VWSVASLAAALFSTVGLASPPPAAAALPPIRHVFVIVLENESESTTFGPGSPAPYLATTLRGEGAFLPNYYGTGHESNDNYISMISGQAPNPQNQSDCQFFTDFTPGTIGSDGQAQGTGCVYPAAVQTIAGQLDAAGLTWRDYNEDMGADPTRETAVCAHPAPIGAKDTTQSAEAQDQYATRHNPFVYFHSIIDDTTLCDTHVVNLDALPQDLGSVSATPNYVFITPDLCDDGHDAPCANHQPGGLAQANQFLQTWVPQITGSPAFRQDGLLIVTFDEASTNDASACCGEIAGPSGSPPGMTGPGGGQVGAVLLSPCIAPGTGTQTPYNHYTMLRSVEDIFGLPHLGYAGLPGETSFGPDIFNQPCGPGVPLVAINAPPLLSSVSRQVLFSVSWSASPNGGSALAGVTVSVTDLAAQHPRSRTLITGNAALGSVTFIAQPGHTYAFSATATNLSGQTSPAASATVVVPSGVRPLRGHYGVGWRVRRVRGAWLGHAITSHVAGARFSLRYTGGSLALVGERGPRGGVARIVLDGRAQTIDLHAARTQTRQVIYQAALPSGGHRLKIVVVSGTVALEGFAITARRG
jgi:hypothetical protein